LVRLEWKATKVREQVRQVQVWYGAARQKTVATQTAAAATMKMTMTTATTTTTDGMGQPGLRILPSFPNTDGRTCRPKEPDQTGELPDGEGKGKEREGEGRGERERRGAGVWRPSGLTDGRDGRARKGYDDDEDPWSLGRLAGAAGEKKARKNGDAKHKNEKQDGDGGQSGLVETNDK
jgi:hypothetical protein